MLLAEPPELSEVVETAARDADRPHDSSSRSFWLFAAAHLIVWTLVPTVAHFNLPADTIEMLFCGHEWQLGYPKHPPLPAWISEAAFVASNHSPWSLYLVAQITVVISFWGVWRLAREFVSPSMALLAVCSLECCYFYTYSSTEYNNNVAMYPCWSLGILFLYWAVEREKLRYWLAAGTVLGLGLLAKYTTMILIVTMVGFLLIHSRTRRVWWTGGPYAMLATALLVFSPHLYWAIAHSFPSIEYALERIKGTNDWVGHVWHPLWFAADQIVEVLPIALVLLVLAGWPVRVRKLAGVARFRRDYLLAMVIVPFLIQVAVSSLRTTHLRPSYGSQLWLFFGLLLLVCFEIRPTVLRWKMTWAGCAIFCSAFIVAMFCHDRAVPGLRQYDARTRFSGRDLAEEVQSLWNRRYSQPLEIVSGAWWLAGNVAAYSGRCQVSIATWRRDRSTSQGVR
jgi:4-amino-4-deoxy-L-arabinose transferase-like glycosyltransferase